MHSGMVRRAEKTEKGCSSSFSPSSRTLACTAEIGAEAFLMITIQGSAE
jgi:hypothetical protein